MSLRGKSFVWRFGVVILMIMGLTACGEEEPEFWRLADGRPAGAPLILYAGVDIYDQSFNESVFRAVDSFAKDQELTVKHIAGNPQDMASDMGNMLQQSPAAVIGLGYFMSQMILDIAADFPETRFVVVDPGELPVSLPLNVMAITFREDEALYLAGMLAAVKSNSQNFGYVTKVHTPLTAQRACAFAQGARSVSSNSQLLYGSSGETLSADEDSQTPVAMARVMFNRGVKAMVVAAGSLNDSLHKIFRGRNDVYTIAVDINKNAVAPGSILTSVVKNAGVSVVNVLDRILNNTWKNTTLSIGMADGSIDVIVDEFNEDVLGDELEERIEDLRTQIIENKISIVTNQETCAAFVKRIFADDPDVEAYIDF